MTMDFDAANRDYVLRTIRERNIHFIRLWFTDVFGQMKSFAITPSELETAFEEGMGFDGSAIEGFALDGETDMLAVPNASTFQILPWRPKDDGVARMFCNIITPDGTPYQGDPRHILLTTLRRVAELGYELNVGPEMEYFYFKDTKSPEPIDQGGYFDLTPFDNATDLRRDTILTLEQMGIPVEYSHHELAPSQQEIHLRYSDALSMADAVMTYRLVVKEIAIKHGCHASFMPKPLYGANGNAMHIHLSLFDEENNVFYDANDPDGHGLSKLAKSFIAGLLHYAPEFSLLTNQYVNSYKRLRPGDRAPRFRTWSTQNRHAMVRVPRYKPHKESSMRLELRSPDPACNPYLVFAALVLAGLKGVNENMELIDELPVNPTPEQELGMGRLPRNLGEAVDKFEDSELMKALLGEKTHSYIASCKRNEWDDYSAQVTPWEIEQNLPIL